MSKAFFRFIIENYISVTLTTDGIFDKTLFSVNR